MLDAWYIINLIILARYTTTRLLLLQLLDWLDIIVPQFDLSSESEEASAQNSPASIPKEFHVHAYISAPMAHAQLYCILSSYYGVDNVLF